jgi:hypothetical protein
MKRVLSLRLFGSYLVLTSLLIAALALAVRNHSSTQASTKSIIVSSSGQRLATLFEGLPQDQRYSLKDILATRSALPKCGKKPDKPSLLQTLFGTAVVYAGCPIIECGGNGWINFTDFCNTGGSCSGSYNSTTQDPQSNNGYTAFRTYCGSSPACGCETYSC